MKSVTVHSAFSPLAYGLYLLLIVFGTIAPSSPTFGQYVLPAEFENAQPMPLPTWSPPIADEPNQVVIYNSEDQIISTHALPESEEAPLPQKGGKPALHLPDSLAWTDQVTDLLSFSNLELRTQNIFH
ncbi:MAG: hypothetical protein ACE362_12020 [Phaeodactylibacter xiamenensis]|uniref:Uncharacterized protein n=1 Tax=Phaeodactylibacter xiamenensis TaxID=1524460 RepID=A0A098S8D1_9BACT|nr:hypothetical protein [Phaeodactylibacter xiamenensis]KGE87317.1 hypothetical protein IX84_16965 [Phaeodactylibacter xiamenensis]MCR9055325.1 hypothetical protein [bacterium]